MYLTTLHTKDGSAVLQLQSTTPEVAQSILGYLANHPDIAPEIKIESNGATKVKPFTFDHTIKAHNGNLQEFERFRPKHPGGRKPKPTACQTCGKEHPSYTLARACCWQAKLNRKG